MQPPEKGLKYMITCAISNLPPRVMSKKTTGLGAVAAAGWPVFSAMPTREEPAEPAVEKAFGYRWCLTGQDVASRSVVVPMNDVICRPKVCTTREKSSVDFGSIPATRF